MFAQIRACSSCGVAMVMRLGDRTYGRDGTHAAGVRGSRPESTTTRCKMRDMNPFSRPMDHAALRSVPCEDPADLVSDGLVTVPEAAAFLRVSRSMIYVLMDRGDLPYVRIGSARRIPKKALVALASSCLTR